MNFERTRKRHHASRPGRAALAASILAAMAFSYVLMPASAEAQPYQSCGQLPECSFGPQHFFYGTHSAWRFFGTDCGLGCNATVVQASMCDAVSVQLAAHFQFSTDDTLHYCNFDCGARGKCSIRGGDGLPVELIGFGVD